MFDGAAIFAQQSPGRLVIAVLLLIGVTIVGGVVILGVRRRATADRADIPFETLSLGELRDMRARGQISDEEYEALRAATLGAFGYSGEAEGRRAAPGVDLTGEPLPGSGPESGPGSGSEPGPEGGGEGSGNR